MARAATPKDRAQVNLFSGAVLTALAGGLLVFGEPAQPGERRNALFLAFEEMIGYHATCGVLVGAGLIWLAVGVWQWVQLRRSTP